MVISTLHDPEGIFFDLIKASQNDLKKMVEQGLIVSCSSVTCLRTLDLLKEIGVEIVGGDSWGEGRRKGLETALKTNFEFLISSDFDKVLHWLKVEKKEFFTYLFFFGKSGFNYCRPLKFCLENLSKIMERN